MEVTTTYKDSKKNKIELSGSLSILKAVPDKKLEGGKIETTVVYSESACRYLSHFRDIKTTKT